jgi:hypothetical protein
MNDLHVAALGVTRLTLNGSARELALPLATRLSERCARVWA